MSYKTIYTCDKCGESKEGDPMFTLRLSLERPYKDMRWGGYIFTPAAADWCRKCHIEAGTLQPYSGKEEIEGGITPNPTPTIEDLIRQIVQQEATQ